MLELTEKRTQFTKLFDLGGGKKRLRINRVPLHYKEDYESDQSPWLEIDTTAEEKDGRYVVERAPYQLEVSLDQVALTYRSRQGGLVQASLDSLDGVLVERLALKIDPRIDGDKIWWEELVPGLDVYLQISPAGVEFFKVVKGEDAPHEFGWEIVKQGGEQLGINRKNQAADNQGRASRVEVEHSAPESLGAGRKKFITRQRLYKQSVHVPDRKTRIKQYKDEIDYPVLVDAPDITENIVSGADDLWTISPDHSTLFSASSNLFGLQNYSLGRYYNLGFRFQGVALPQGCNIDLASLKIYVNYVSASPYYIEANVYADDVDDAPAFSTGSMVRDITKTTAYAYFNPTSTGLKTIDVTDIVQEIVDRGGWSSGNDMRFGIFCTAASSPPGTPLMGVDAYEKSGGTPAYLEIEYTESGAVLLSAGLDMQTETAGAGLSLICNLAASINQAVSTSSAALIVARNLTAAIDMNTSVSPVAVGFHFMANLALSVSTSSPMLTVSRALTAQTEFSTATSSAVLARVLPISADLDMVSLTSAALLSRIWNSSALVSMISNTGNANLGFPVTGIQGLVHAWMNLIGAESATLGLGENHAQILPAGMGAEDREALRLAVGAWAGGIQAATLALLGESVASIQGIRLEVQDFHKAQGVQALRQTVMAGTGIRLSIGTVGNGPFQIGETVEGTDSGASGIAVAVGEGLLDLESPSGIFIAGEMVSGQTSGASAMVGGFIVTTGRAVFRAAAYEIYLDGMPVRRRITGARINMDEDFVHNTIDIDSSDRDLFFLADPVQGQGLSRIEVQVGTRVFYFLLETRSGTEESFQIWGRSLTAVQDSPHAVDVVFTLEEARPASEIAADLAGPRALDWQCEDWVAPATFEFQGPPLSGIVDLATEIGAVVRSQDDGSFLVRKRYPVRPVEMPAAQADIEYDRELTLIELSFSEQAGTGHNRILVNGYSENVDLPLMEVEETTGQGEDTFVRVYWGSREPSDIPDHYATDGQVLFLGASEEDFTEAVDFFDGAGQVSKPIKALKNIKWVGDASPGVDWAEHSSELQLQDTNETLGTRYRVAEVTYTARYWRYRLHGHDVERMIMALTVPSVPDTTVSVAMGDGDYEADSIEAPLLFGDAAAAARGMAWLDENRYHIKDIQVMAPYDDRAVDGVLADIDDGALSITGKCHVRAAEILFDGPRVVNILECRQCLVS